MFPELSLDTPKYVKRINVAGINPTEQKEVSSVDEYEDAVKGRFLEFIATDQFNHLIADLKKICVDERNREAARYRTRKENLYFVEKLEQIIADNRALVEDRLYKIYCAIHQIQVPKYYVYFFVSWENELLNDVQAFGEKYSGVFACYNVCREIESQIRIRSLLGNISTLKAQVSMLNQRVSELIAIAPPGTVSLVIKAETLARDNALLKAELLTLKSGATSSPSTEENPQLLLLKEENTRLLQRDAERNQAEMELHRRLHECEAALLRAQEECSDLRMYRSPSIARSSQPAEYWQQRVNGSIHFFDDPSRIPAGQPAASGISLSHSPTNPVKLAVA